MGTVINPLGGYLVVNSSIIGTSNSVNITGNALITGCISITSTGYLSIANITNATILNATMYTSNISSSSIIQTGYINRLITTLANITYANITTANITNANIIIANVNTANITAANITNANIKMANISSLSTSSLNTNNLFQTGNILIPPGVIMLWSGNTTPSGWLLCDGNSYSVTTYYNLYLAIGTTYGSGSNSFCVPKFSGSFPLGVSTSTYNLGNTGGNTTITLSSSQLPAHNHTITITDPGHTHTLTESSHNHTISSIGSHTHSISIDGTYLKGSSSQRQYSIADRAQYWYGYSDTTLTISGTTGSAQSGISISQNSTGATIQSASTGITLSCASTGSGAQMSIMNPYLAIYYIIKY